MRRTLTLFPLALYSAACALEPATMPAHAPVATWEAEPAAAPPPMEVPTSPRIDAMTRWQLPSGSPWSRFEKMTLLASMGLAPRTMPLPPAPRTNEVLRAEAAARAVASGVRGGLGADAMWVVDLHGAASVAFGAMLSQHATVPIANVLTFNNWPAEDEVVPAEETLAALVQHTPKLPRANDAARPVFLLDAWRLADKGEEPDEELTDNRYFLTSADLPDAEQLRAAGVRRVMYLVPSVRQSPREEDDLNEIFLSYQQAGITLHLVDLDGLSVPLPARAASAPEDGAYIIPYQEPFAAPYLYIEPRATVIDDPYFYRRSRGGFGGEHGGGGHHGGTTSHGGGGYPSHGIGGSHGIGVGWGGGGG